MQDNAKTPKSFQCTECGLHYNDKATAKKCGAWCSEYKSCNLEITQFSIESKKVQKQ